MLSDWNWKTPITRICRISKRASPTARRVGHERESTSRHSDWKYSRNVRFEESSRITSRRHSLYKMRESHDTIKRLTSEIPELQERVNCMNDSGELQKRIGSTTAMPMSERGPSTMNSCVPSLFVCWKIRFKTQVRCYVMDRRSGDGGFSG